MFPITNSAELNRGLDAKTNLPASHSLTSPQLSLGFPEAKLFFTATALNTFNQLARLVHSNEELGCEKSAWFLILANPQGPTAGQEKHWIPNQLSTSYHDFYPFRQSSQHLTLSMMSESKQGLA